MTKITICPKCESKIVKSWVENNKIRYMCLSCKRMFNDNTKKIRELKNDDYIIINDKTVKEDKDKIYNFLFKDLKSKNKFLNRSDVDKSLIKWLNINYIKIEGVEQNLEEIYFYLSDLKEDDRHCKICGNKTKFIGIRDRKVYNDFCSDKCLYEYRSNEQIGYNNNVFKIKDKEKWKENISNAIKNKILSGEFTPCVTNSWCHSRVESLINDKIIKHRSSWESFFHIKTPNLEYEKIRIPYVFENVEHNYIVDFVDDENKILYEIKPRSEKTKIKNKIKRKYAIEWANKNKYVYKIIEDEWFFNNYDEKLIEDQPNKEKLLKNLKQFNENKKDKKNRL